MFHRHFKQLCLFCKDRLCTADQTNQGQSLRVSGFHFKHSKLNLLPAGSKPSILSSTLVPVPNIEFAVLPINPQTCAPRLCPMQNVLY